MEQRAAAIRLLNRLLSVCLISTVTLLTACGGGGGGGGGGSSGGGSGGGGGGGGGTPSASLSGGGVDGPLANAIVTAYAVDVTQAGFRGAVVGTGTTNERAEIQGIDKPDSADAPFLLEFTADADTRDLTACEDDDSSGTIEVLTECVAPVVGTLRTIVTAEMLDADRPVYATLLTTMATDLAIKNADYDGDEDNNGSLADVGDKKAWGDRDGDDAIDAGLGDGTPTVEELLSALPVAAAQVKSTVGFGLDSTTDIFTTPPILDETTDTAEEQEQVAAYRSAVQALASVVNQISTAVGGAETTAVLTAMTDDLADGEIDGQADGAPQSLYDGEGDSAGSGATAALQLLDQDPATLPVPNDPLNRTVGDMSAILVDEITTTGNSNVNTQIDENTDVVLQPAVKNPDIDGDGIPNEQDAFPNDPNEFRDTDRDGAGNNADPDDDNDGVLDGNDAFPLNAAETTDTDGDQIGNNADPDDDNDGTPDAQDDFPLDATKQNKSDVDNDGWPSDQDPNDNDDTNPGTEFTDTDLDGIGNTTDDDDDNDGVPDADDAFPLNAAEQRNLDGDAFGDNSDDDIDGDGRPNHTNGNSTANTADSVATVNLDRFPRNPNEWEDTDRDGIGNNADTDDDNDGLSDSDEVDAGTNPLLRDTDGDGVLDGTDAFPLDPTASFDADGDGIPVRPAGSPGISDNCPATPNPLQTDTDNDGLGDKCDKDDDNDGVLDADDDLPLDSRDSVDTDGDGIGNSIDTDDDGDGVADANDAFPLNANESIDTDGDGVGNVADEDDDGDGVSDGEDAFPLDGTKTTLSDTDNDNDGWRLEQDPDDNDDTNPGVPFVDTDGDGIGDAIDPDDDNDGVPDGDDQLPLDGSDFIDTDGDTIGNRTDTDDDDDGVPDSEDRFPLNAAESVDTDGDGIGNNADTDDDGDGIPDGEDSNSLNPDVDGDGVYDGADNCPAISNTDQKNSDGDNNGGDACDTDDDNDTVPDGSDNCPLISNTDQANADGDARGDVCDTDDDNDNVPDAGDNCPAIANANQLDTDADTIGNVCDDDDDGDGVSDGEDAFPLDASETADTDSDGTGDNGDNCPAIANQDQLDTDSDALGNACDDDDDGDTLTDAQEESLGTNPLLVDTDADGSNDNTDNCPINSNSDQLNTDGDELGNVCDDDDDGDGVADGEDAFPLDASESVDTDSDGTGDNSDNCPAIANEDQLDTDGDELGNACDDDDDGDTLSDTTEIEQGTNPLLADTDSDGSADNVDNCPVLANADQADSNDNGVGDACEGAPADIAGFWLAAITVSDVQQTGSAPQGANLAEICDAAIDDKKAGIAYVKQQGNDINLNFDDGEGDGEVGSIDGIGNVQFGGNTDVDTRYDYSSVTPVPLYTVTETLDFSGVLDANASTITGTTITETVAIYTGEDLDAEPAATCTYTFTGTLNRMSAVDASVILNPAGADQGIAFTDSWRNYFGETGVDIYEFGYSTVTTAGATDFVWTGAAFENDSRTRWMLSSAGWIEVNDAPAVDGTPATTATLVRGNGSVNGSVWQVSAVSAPITTLPQLEFASEDWEQGVANPDADFVSADARGVGVTVVTQMDEYDLPCDYSLYPQGVLSCENWILSSYPGSGRREDITTVHLATALSELLHASGSVPTTPIAGVPIGSIDDNESDDRIHQIFAWLVGSDLSGSVGTNGAVHFYTHDGITDAVRINGVTANWTIVDPNGDGHAVLQFTIPDEIQPYYFYWNFEESRNVIMAVETLSDEDSYVRVGTFTPSGTEFNFAGINVTALNELINGFSYSKPDTDGDGVADDADNCPSDANADQADADSDGRGDVCDSIEPPADQDGDGVNDDIDNCPAVSNANQSDMDGDGQGDFCDTDIDGDGIENGSDTCPMDATNSCNGSDADGDGVNDDTDNCPSVYNPDQADSNGNNVGDACDAGLRLDSDSDGFVDSEDAFPLDATEQNDADGDDVGDNSDVCPFLADVTDCVNTDVNANGIYVATFTASGEEFDEGSGACVAVSEPNGKEIVEFTQIGSQLLVRGGDMDDEFEHRGTIATNGDFSVSTVEANFSFTLTGSHVAGTTFNGAFTENDNGCEQTATVVFTPAAAITESSVGGAGLTWLESDSQWNDNSQTDTIEAFYGVISDTGPETFFTYDASTRSWVEETEVSNEYLITTGGVVTLQDRFTIDSYLDAGETAVVRAYETDGTTVSTLLEAHVVLEELNIEGMLISKVVGEALGHGLTPDAVFTTGARAFVARITEQNEAYEFWCDDDWNDYVANNYECANVVAKSYQDLNGDGQDDPVAAIDLDEVVYTPAEFDNGTAVGGGLWAGEGYDAGGDYYLNAYLISDDGTATGSNPLVRVAKHYRNGVSNYWTEKTVIAEFSYSAVTRGGISIIEWDLPAIVAKLGDLDAYELHPFIFEESSLDEAPLVRRGERVLSGTEERELLLNPAARTQALAAFNWVAGVYTNNAESVLFAFLPSGEYFSVQWAEPNGFIGFERGGFSQYGDELYVNVQQNDDGEALLCDPSQGGDCSDIMLPIAVGASDLTAYPGTPDEFVFARENFTGTGIEGIWKAADDTVLMMFLPGNVYVAIQWEEANGFVGFERGTYSLNDDQLSVTVTQNDDGEALICQLEAGTGCSEQTLTIGVDMDSLVVNPGVDDFMLHRAL